MCGVRIARLVFSFSVWLLGVLIMANGLDELKAQLKAAESREQLDAVLAQIADGDYPPTLKEYAGSRQARSQEPSIVKRTLLASIEIAMQGESPAAPAETSAIADAKSIVSRPAFRDAGVARESNWLSRAWKRVLDMLPTRNLQDREQPNINLSGPPKWVDYLLFALLAAGAVTLLVVISRMISFRRALRRRVSAMLEEDEPDRTLDEWLTLADQLEREGRYREGVRCLYLACLLRCDEAGVARFQRSETNWEHLARIHRSSQRPPELDLRGSTSLFDRVWYGHQVRGKEDLEEMRGHYVAISEILRPRVQA